MPPSAAGAPTTPWCARDRPGSPVRRRPRRRAATPAYDSAGRRSAPRRASPGAGGRFSGRSSSVLPAILFHRRSSASCPMSIRSSAASVGVAESEGSRNEQFGARNRSSTARKSDSLDPGLGQKPVEPKRAANGSAFPVDFRQRPERLLDRELLSGAFGENLVGVARQRFRHAPDVVIGLPRETARASGGGLRAGPVPQPHQAMLQHRKLIELVAAIVDAAARPVPARSSRPPFRSVCGSPPRAGRGSDSARDIGSRSPPPAGHGNRRSRR